MKYHMLKRGHSPTVIWHSTLKPLYVSLEVCIALSLKDRPVSNLIARGTILDPTFLPYMV